MNLPRYLLFFLIIPTMASAQVVINEYSCSNWKLTADNFGGYEDWVELYNTSNTPVNLSGYYLSDRITQNTKWQFPNGVSINAHSYLIIWASGRDESTVNDLHTNFRLSQTKFPLEQIVLSDANATVIDQVNLQVTKKHHSRGRIPDGSFDWKVMTIPSPEIQNNAGGARNRYADRPAFDFIAGFYPGPLTVIISSTEANATIRYTVDGTEPTAASPVYNTPVLIDSTTVLKAIVIPASAIVSSSFIHYATYFINESITLPVVSIAANDLTDLANGDGNLRPEGTIEYFNIHHVLKTAGYGEFNRHGRDSWALDQRSVDFIMRDEFGYNYALQEQLFSLTDRDEFQRIILRAGGDDNYPAAHQPSNEGSAHLRDAYLQNLSKAGNLHLDVRVATKSVVFMNGQYWGVYDIREIPDDHDYTEYNYDQGKFDLQYILTWGSTWAEYGGTQALDDWEIFYNYIMSNDMSNSVHWNNVTSKLDVASLVDYVIVNSISVCSDWLNYNTGWWRGLDSAGTHKKWGYILWDNDAVFGFYRNYTGIPNKDADAAPCNVEDGLSDPEGHIDLLNKLRQNISFNRYYISRYIDLLNTVFSCDNMLGQLDSISAVIDPEMTRHAIRWNGTYTEWQNNVQQLRDYIEDRCMYLPGLMDSCYNLTGPYPLYVTTTPLGTGKVKINSLTLVDFPWSGLYYGGIPVYLNAYPDTLNGFSFHKWETFNNPVLPSALVANAEMNISSGDTLIAYFKQPTTFIFESKDDNLYVLAAPSVFSDETTINYSLKVFENMEIELFNAVGIRIMKINPESDSPGNYSFKLNLREKGLAAGMYLLNFKSENINRTIRLLYSRD